jgi:hypothetical protein
MIKGVRLSSVEINMFLHFIELEYLFPPSQARFNSGLNHQAVFIDGFLESVHSLL